jgi:hypothetical protein
MSKRLFKIMYCMRHCIFLIFFCFSLSPHLFAQDESFLQKSVCSIDDDMPVRQNNIISQCQLLEKNDELNSFLYDIKRELNINSSAHYAVKNIANATTACALITRKDNVTLERVIALNKNYYLNKFNNLEYRKAAYIFILGHEITHHINDDLFYSDEQDELKNWAKEVFADENAGYLVSRLAPDITLSDLEKILPVIIKKNVDTSKYHPLLKYRICAAKAGWLRAKGKDQVAGTFQKIQETTITKTIIGSKSINYCEVKLEDSLEITNFYSENDSLIYYYFGYSRSNGLQNGEGLDIKYINGIISYLGFGSWKNGSMEGKSVTIGPDYKFIGNFNNGQFNGSGVFSWKIGDRYFGNFVNGNREGFGIYYWPDGTIYMGEWKNSNLSGYGVKYNGSKVINAGCWYNDKYIGENCK